MKYRLATALVLFLVLLVSGSAVQAENLESTLGSHGEVYLSKVGKLSELFPGADPRSGDPEVLALEILRPGEKPEWLLVPESEWVRSDASRYVLFEDATETVFVVWEGRIGSHPMIKLAYYQNGAWSEVFQVSEDVWTWKGFPQLAITRDSFEVGENGTTRRVDRTVLHVVWWEETVDGYRTFYRPLVLKDGQLLGLGPLVALNDVVEGQIAEGGETPTVGLLRRPVLAVNENGRSMTVTLAEPATRKLLVVDIGLLPAGLGLLGDDTGDFIEGLGGSSQADVESIAGLIRAHIVIIGNRYRLNPRLIQSLAQEVHDRVVADYPDLSSEDLSSIAGVIRAHIVIIGARLSHETLDRFDQALSTSVLRVSFETEPVLFSAVENGEPDLLRMTLSNVLPIPAIPEGETHVFSSPDGQRVVVGWEEEGLIGYRESLADGSWSEVRTMEVGSELARSEALEVLQLRAVHR